jgi:type VI secretion system protein ImpE
MKADELFRTGRLAEAVQAQTAAVKANPADPARRTFLFELLVFSGDLDRARKQLDALRHDDIELEAAVAIYRNLLTVEEARRTLFSEGIRPQFLAPPPEHLLLRLEGLDRLRGGDQAGAVELLTRAAELTPVVRGLLNTQPFTGLVDGDDRFGGIVEVMSEERYFWLPIEQIDMLAANEPKSPRDLLWAPARLEVRGGPAGGVFLPVLYPASHEQADDAAKLGRVTEWLPLAGEFFRGVGTHTFHVGTDQEMGLLDLRMLEIEAAPSEPPPASGS